MYCGVCGNQNPDAARFCTSCGEPLTVSSPSNAPQQPSPPPSGSYPPPPRQYEVPTYSPPSGSGYEHIPNYLAQAILVTIFCCLPAGIVSIVFAAQVNGKIARGEIIGARSDSQNAKTWAWVSFGLGIAAALFYLFALCSFGLAGI